MFLTLSNYVFLDNGQCKMEPIRNSWLLKMQLGMIKKNLFGWKNNLQLKIWFVNQIINETDNDKYHFCNGKYTPHHHIKRQRTNTIIRSAKSYLIKKSFFLIPSFVRPALKDPHTNKYISHILSLVYDTHKKLLCMLKKKSKLIAP